MKTYKVVCKKCGEIEMDGFFTDNGEEWLGYPVSAAPTILVLGKAYKQYMGTTFAYATGNKFKDDWEKKWHDTMSHLDIYESEEDSKEHRLEPMEMWSLII